METRTLFMCPLQSFLLGFPFEQASAEETKSGMKTNKDYGYIKRRVQPAI